MTDTIFVLLVANFVLPVAFACRQCLSRQGIQINHVFLFTFGYMFYWVVPILFGYTKLANTDAAIYQWSNYFQSVPTPVMETYLAFGLAFSSSFYLGSSLGARLRFYTGNAVVRADEIVPVALARHLRQGGAALCQSLEDRLAPPVRAWLAGWNQTDPLPPDVALALLAGVNGWLQSDPGGEGGVRARRVQLQQAFPDSIVARVRAHSRWQDLRFAPGLLLPYLLIGALFSGIYAFQLRGDLFHGYANDSVSEHILVRGTFIAFSMLLLGVAMVYTFYRERLLAARPPLRRLLNPYMLTYAFVGILVLSMGGRLYFVSSACMVLIYITVYERRFTLRKFLITLAVMFTSAGAVGAARLGGNVNAATIVGSVFTEPIGTSISLISFLGSNPLQWLTAPRLLATDFLNLIPSVIFPDKGYLLQSPADLGYKIYAPQGAMHSAVSFLMNFGLLGSVIVIFFYGIALSQLRRSEVPLFRVMYIMLAAWSGFTLFRDPFGISVVKTMFEFSILFPVLMVVTASGAQRWLAPMRAAKHLHQS